MDYNSSVMDGFKHMVQGVTGRVLSGLQVAAFESYYSLLSEWNQKVNLSALRSREEIFRKHFLDSLSCVRVLGDSKVLRMADVGSGGGFPGLPLKILLPEMQLTLIEAVQKKARFLELVVRELDLQDVEVIPTRAESAGQDRRFREQFDWAVGRAVAPLPVLAEYLLPLVRVGGRALAQKGAKAEREAAEAAGAIALLGGELADLQRVVIERLEEERWLVVMGKVAQTPEKYPRREGLPKKRPLG